MQMQDEILALWLTRRMTMLLVTHYVDEAIYMSDRVAIMSPRPGRIERIIDIHAERPRERNHPKFVELRSKILELLHFAGPNPEERRAKRVGYDETATRINRILPGTPINGPTSSG
jgi:NitT/TauT family transport system ATP-binding protein/sulfonate transport system ATP-binding protein